MLSNFQIWLLVMLVMSLMLLTMTSLAIVPEHTAAGLIGAVLTGSALFTLIALWLLRWS